MKLEKKPASDVIVGYVSFGVSLPRVILFGGYLYSPSPSLDRY
jgi:hypothetical protein